MLRLEDGPSYYEVLATKKSWEILNEDKIKTLQLAPPEA